MNYSFSNRIAALQPSIIREILKASSGQNVIPFAAGNPARKPFLLRRFAHLLNPFWSMIRSRLCNMALQKVTFPSGKP
ncbi:hypothetical protein P9222_23190 [Paenibacillus amylolyticus]|nr:hypothetical protein [Paenibacillus amylolyticus]WFR61340.1 hypothetical protein P9222_23190 [Paenibacillus amylolyticus]